VVTRRAFITTACHCHSKDRKVVTGAPAEQVRQTYLETLHTLSADARIHDYLALLVARRVMAAYRMRRTPPR
jgi:hypothetical protein